MLTYTNSNIIRYYVLTFLCFTVQGNTYNIYRTSSFLMKNDVYNCSCRIHKDCYLFLCNNTLNIIRKHTCILFLNLIIFNFTVFRKFLILKVYYLSIPFEKNILIEILFKEKY